MAGTTYNALVNLLGDTTGFSNAMKKASWDSAALGQKMQAVGGIMSNVGRMMTYAVTLPIVAGFALATKAAIDEEKEMALLSEAIQQNTDATLADVAATEEWITAQQNATGVSDGELRPALAKLVAATKDVTKSQELLKVAMDISAATGKPLETVTSAIQKAYLGNIGALGRLGIATKNAKGETMSFEAVMRNAIATYGGAAATAADTTAGKFAILKARISDLIENVGFILIPYVMKAVDALSKLVGVFERMPEGTQKLAVGLAAAAAAAGPILFVLGKVVSIIGVIMGIAGGGWIAAIIAAIVAVAAALGALYAKSEAFRNFVGSLWSLFTTSVQQMWATVQPLLQQLWALIVEGYEYLRDNVDWAALWADLQPVIASATQLITQFVVTMVTGITTVVNFIRDNWSTIGPIVKTSLDIAILSVQTFFRVLTPIIQTVTALLRGDWSTAWEKAKEAVRAMAEGVTVILSTLGIAIGRLAVAAMKALWQAFQDGVAKAVDFVSGLPGKAAAALATLAGLLKSAGAAGMRGLWNGLKDVWGDVSGWVKDLPGKIKGYFAGAAQWLWNAGSSIMSGLLEGIKSAWEDVAEFLSNLGGKIKSLKGPLEKDRQLLVPEGRAIMDGLLAGMTAGSTGVLDFASRLSDSIAVGGSGRMAFAGASAGDSLVINVDARGSTDPAAVERAAERGARRAVAVYAKLHESNRRSGQ